MTEPRFFAKPLLPVVALAAVYGAGVAVLAMHGARPTHAAEFIWKEILALFLVRWVAVDRRTTRFHGSYEFDAFLFIGWVIVLPYYLVKTRGGRGLLPLLGFWAIAIIPSLVGEIMLLTRRA
jgi:hypothetical protein